MVPAGLERADFLAHAIENVVFASPPVVADHHHLRHHSWVLELIETQAVKVADASVIAHARYFLFQISVPPAGDGALEAILAVYQANLAVLEADEVLEAPEVVDLVDQRELQEHRRK